jgi:hypothetical protein
MVIRMRFVFPIIACVWLQSHAGSAPEKTGDSANPKSGRSPLEWVQAHKNWVIAGGGAAGAGILLWALLSSSGSGSGKAEIAKPADLGLPPEDPAVKAAP